MKLLLHIVNEDYEDYEDHEDYEDCGLWTSPAVRARAALPVVDGTDEWFLGF